MNEKDIYDVLRLGACAKKKADHIAHQLSKGILRGKARPETMAALATLFAQKERESFQTWIQEELKREFEKLSQKVDRPLEDPHDLGEIRMPTINDYRDFYKGDKEWSSYFRAQGAILKGNDGRRYAICVELEPIRPWAYFSLALLPGDATAHFPPSPHSMIEYDHTKIGCQEFSEKMIWWIPKEQDPEALSGEFIKYVASPSKHYLTVNHGSFHLELTSTILGMPFWYNKGRIANIRVGGFPFRGFEGSCSAKGTMLLQGKKVNLNGYGTFEFIYWYYGMGDWGPRDWLHFTSDQIYGLLIHEHESGYKDGCIVLRDENRYLIPTDFTIEYTKYDIDYAHPDKKNKIPIETHVTAETLEGTLDITCKAIGRYGYSNLFSPFMIEEIAYLTEGKFTLNNGKEIMLTNGVTWHEVMPHRP